MATTWKQAEEALPEAKALFEQLATVIYIGITRIGDDVGLRVLLYDEPPSGSQVPSSVKGVPVMVKVVGDAVTQGECRTLHRRSQHAFSCPLHQCSAKNPCFRAGVFTDTREMSTMLVYLISHFSPPLLERGANSLRRVPRKHLHCR